MLSQPDNVVETRTNCTIRCRFNLMLEWNIIA